MKRWLHPVETAIIFVSRLLNNIGVFFLIAMMLLTVADVFMRYVLNRPILGSVEITRYLMVSLAFLGLAWCAVVKGHVRVELLISRLSPRAQAIFDSITCFFSLFIFVLITTYGFLEARERWAFYEASDVLQIPSYPFFLVLAFGSAILCLVLITNLIQFISQAVKP